MPKPDEKTSSHWASSEEDCEKMEQKYDWKLVEVNKDPSKDILPVECVFEGDAEFPKGGIGHSEGQTND